jgi:hypothetical protein
VSGHTGILPRGTRLNKGGLVPAAWGSGTAERKFILQYEDEM